MGAVAKGVFALLVMCTGCAGSNAVAEIAVSPLIINLVGEAGTRLPFQFQVANRSNMPSYLDLSFVEIHQQENGMMDFSDDGNHTLIEGQNTFPGWFEFADRPRRLELGKVTKIKGIINIPRNMEGSYVTALIVQEKPRENELKAISLTVRYAIVVNLTIGERPKRANSTFDQLTFQIINNKPVLTALFSNDSQFIGSFISTVKIRNANRKLVSKVVLKTESAWARGDEHSIVYPGASVTLVAPLNFSIEDKSHQLVVQNKFNNRAQTSYRKNVIFSMPDTTAGRKRVVHSTPYFQPSYLTVKRRSDGTATSSLIIHNPLSEPLNVDFTNATDLEAWSGEFKMVPPKLTLGAGKSARIILRQTNLHPTNETHEIQFSGVSDDGRQHSIILRTVM